MLGVGWEHRPTFGTVLQELNALCLEEQGLSPGSTPPGLINYAPEDWSLDHLDVP